MLAVEVLVEPPPALAGSSNERVTLCLEYRLNGEKKLHACGTRGGTELNRAQLGAKYGAQEPQDIYRISSMERALDYESRFVGSSNLSSCAIKFSNSYGFEIFVFIYLFSYL